MDRIVYEEDDNRKPRISNSLAALHFNNTIGNEFREPMKIGLGQFYHNKTRRYLTPILKYYGKSAWSKIITMPTLAWGVSDQAHQAKIDKCFTNHLFALVDTESSKEYFFDLAPFILDWLDKQSFVAGIYDYVVDGKTLTMIIFELPSIFEGSIKKLLASDYSGIYNTLHIRDIEQYISSYIEISDVQYYNPVYGVVTKDPKQKEFFGDLVRDRFNVKLPDEKIVGFEFTANKSQEIFNYDFNEHNSFIFDECVD